MPKHLTIENFKTEVTESAVPVIIKAFAAWCGPCIQMIPVFNEVEKGFAERANFLELDVDQARELAIQFGISSIPTLIFIKDGHIVHKQTGYTDTQTLTNIIERFLKHQ